MQLKRIKYVSRQKVPMTRDEIDDIVRVSARNNPRRDVTGAMMASSASCRPCMARPSTMWT